MAKKEETTEAVDAVPTTVPEAPKENQGLNLTDIRACVTIIDIVTKRGAFAELADVGQVRNRLDKFLNAAAAAQAPATTEEAPAETEDEVTA
jgi:hypothetical protein